MFWFERHCSRQILSISLFFPDLAGNLSLLFLGLSYGFMVDHSSQVKLPVDVKEAVQVANAFKECSWREQGAKLCFVLVEHTLAFEQYVQLRLVLFYAGTAQKGLSHSKVQSLEGFTALVKAFHLPLSERHKKAYPQARLKMDDTFSH